jgi:hypothetical protein
MSRATVDRLIVYARYEEPTPHWRYERETRTFDLEAVETLIWLTDAPAPECLDIEIPGDGADDRYEAFRIVPSVLLDKLPQPQGG